MLANNLFYLLLVLQCVHISWYLPGLLFKRMRTVITEYPPADYPLLYPKPESEYHAYHGKFKLVNTLLLVAGLTIVGAAIWQGAELLDKDWTMFPWAIFMVQMIPIMWIEISECSNFKTLRTKDKRKVKVAGMQSRSLSELVSGKLFIAWLVLFVAAAWIKLWTENYSLSLDSSALPSLIILVVANLAALLFIRTLISGKRQDPYQDPADKLRQSKALVTGLIYVSMGVSLFLAINGLIDFYKLDHLQPVVMSVYCQLIAFASITTNLNGIKLEDINFDVYKKTGEVNN